MLKALARYVGTFVAVYLATFWLTLLIRSGELSNPLELTFGWLLLMGGWLWFAALISAAPVILIALAWRPGQGHPIRARRVWGALWSIVIGLPLLGAWGAAAGMYWPIVYLQIAGPGAVIGALAVAGIALSGAEHIPSGQRVAGALGCVAVLGLVYRVVVPALAPAFAYRFFDSSVAVPIAEKAISEVRRGDSVAVLVRRLPGFLDERALRGEEYRTGGLMGHLEYSIVIRGGVVDSIEVGEASD